MKATEGQMGQAGGYGADLPGEIYNQLQKATSPVLEKALGQTRDLMGESLGRFYDIAKMGPNMGGTTAMDLSPTQKLGVMGKEFGYMVGDLEASSRLSDYLGGQMENMYSRAMQAAQMGQQSLADQYNRLGQQQQMLWQQAEAEKDRALQRELAELAARSSGGGGGPVFIGGDANQQEEEIIEVEEPGVVEKVANWTDKNVLSSKASKGIPGYYKGTDLTQWNKMTGPQKFFGATSLWNPLTWAKTGGGILGDYIGNLSNEQRNKWNKLLGR